MTAATYTRVSTDEQAREGVSLDMQQKRCREVKVYQFVLKDRRTPRLDALNFEIHGSRAGSCTLLPLPHPFRP